MPNSMTAFARQQIQAEWGTLSCEIRSVNHRYLEMSIRLPEQIRDIEMNLRDILRTNVQRGKLEVNFRLQLEQAQTAEIKLNEALLQQVITTAELVNAKLARPGNLSALQLMQWPGVLDNVELEEAIIQKVALELFAATLKEYNKNRLREGNELKNLIQQRLISMAENVNFVRSKMPNFIAAKRKAIQDKFAELKLQIDADRLEQEMVLFVQKSDVDEELDRLAMHINEVERVLNAEGQIGRRLDFLMQELNREANTLSSKSISTEITQASVELKVAIEQMREQIQNIE